MQEEQTEFAVTISLPFRLLGVCNKNRIRRDSFNTLPIAWSVQQEQTEFAVTVFLPIRLLGVCNKNE